MGSTFKKNLLPSFLLCLCLTNFLHSKDFGIRGELFSIGEENLILTLQKQLSSQFSLPTFQKLLKETEERAKHPQSPFVPPDAQKSRVSYYDPTYTVPESIADLHEKIIISKETRVNPLKNLQLSSGLLFFDGDNPDHLTWAREQKGAFKWILVHGNPFELELQEKRPVYFDQNGSFVLKLQLQQIPARVTQDGLFLKIEEIALSEPEAS